MRRMCLVVFSFVAVSCFSEIAAQFETNKTHSFLNFVETIAGKKHRSPALKAIFEKSPYNNVKNKRLIDEVKGIMAVLEGSSYAVEEQSGARTFNVNLSRVFLIASAQSSSLDDFQGRTVGLLPYPIHAELLETLRKLEPVYDALIWEKSSAQLTEKAEELRKAAAAVNFTGAFAKAARFYGVSWPERVPFRVILNPIPVSRGSTNSESLGAVQSIGVLLGKGSPTALDVVFHEICHSLNEAQPLELRNERETAFSSSRSRSARIADGYLNEALATAIGNGWINSLRTGRVDMAMSWYDDSFIDPYAKAIYAKVIEYMGGNRRIDRSFYEHAINAFDGRFPKASGSFESIMSSIVLSSDNTTLPVDDISPIVKRHFDVRDLRISAPMDHEVTMDLVKNGSRSIVIFVSENDIGQLAAVIDLIEGLARYKNELVSSKRNYIFSAFDGKGRAVIILKMKKMEEVEKTIKRLKAKGSIDTEAPFEYL